MGGRLDGKNRQTVFFAAVDPMDKKWVDQEEEHDLTQPIYAAYKQIWKIAEDAVDWVDIGRAQIIGWKF